MNKEREQAEVILRERRQHLIEQIQKGLSAKLWHLPVMELCAINEALKESDQNDHQE